jgi:hypothetical protein
MSTRQGSLLPRDEAQKEGDAMKLVKHGAVVVAIIEHGWEKSYLKAQQGTVEWVPLFLSGGTTPYAEVHAASRHVRLYAGQEVLDQQEVFYAV